MAATTEPNGAARQEIEKAMREKARVVLVMEGDRGSRRMEGTPVEIFKAPDGRERLRLEVAKGSTEQLVLIERVSQVLPAVE